MHLEHTFIVMLGLVLVAQEYTHNVGGKSYQHIMCADSIDIVYTWVNGSDPKHKKGFTLQYFIISS